MRERQVADIVYDIAEVFEGKFDYKQMSSCKIVCSAEFPTLISLSLVLKSDVESFPHQYNHIRKIEHIEYHSPKKFHESGELADEVGEGHGIVLTLENPNVKTTKSTEKVNIDGDEVVRIIYTKYEDRE